jgi:predicted AAA+ superfamily ATPase
MSLTRKIAPAFEEYLKIFPATGIIGPRQVGKTTLVKEFASQKELFYLDLEDSSDREKLVDATFYFDQFPERNFILDEIQFMPQLFNELRGIIDSNRRPGRFVVIGSASPDIIRVSSESLAGRIGYLELTPFSLAEVDSTSKLWVRGGFPLAYLADTDRISSLWRNNFMSTYIQRDLGLLGLQTDVQIMDRFWRMLATSQGNLLNTESFARSLDVSRPTILRFLHFLEGAFMIRMLRPWYVNTNKRLVKSPKVYIRDSGLLHSLLGLQTFESVINHVQMGASWEGFVIEQIIHNLERSIQPWFHRTQQGAECDILLERNGKVIAAIEIKHGSSPKASKGFRVAIQDTGASAAYIIGNTDNTFKIDDTITITNLSHFLTEVLHRL